MKILTAETLCAEPFVNIEVPLLRAIELDGNMK